MMADMLPYRCAGRHQLDAKLVVDAEQKKVDPPLACMYHFSSSSCEPGKLA